MGAAAIDRNRFRNEGSALGATSDVHFRPMSGAMQRGATAGAIVKGMATRTTATSLRRRRIYRWVAAVGLLATAEDQRGADVPETNAIGLMGTHAACEAMLGLIVGPLPYAKGQPARERYFPDLLALASSTAKPRLSQALRGELMTMHDVRNGFVHGGTTVDANELDRAIDAAHSLAEHVPLPGHTTLVGVPTVVADVIDIERSGCGCVMPTSSECWAGCAGQRTA